MKEDKDVIEPDAQVVDGEERAKGVDAAEKEADNSKEDKSEKVKVVEKTLAGLIQKAYADKEEEDLPNIPKRDLLYSVKEIRDHTEYYNSLFDESEIEDILENLIYQIGWEYVTEYYLKNKDKGPQDLYSGPIRNLEEIFPTYEETLTGLQVSYDAYLENKKRN